MAQKKKYAADGKLIGARSVTSAQNGAKGGRPRVWVVCPRCGTPWEGARQARACLVCRNNPEYDRRRKVGVPADGR